MESPQRRLCKHKQMKWILLHVDLKSRLWPAAKKTETLPVARTLCCQERWKNYLRGRQKLHLKRRKVAKWLFPGVVVTKVLAHEKYVQCLHGLRAGSVKIHMLLLLLFVLQSQLPSPVTATNSWRKNFQLWTACCSKVFESFPILSPLCIGYPRHCMPYCIFGKRVDGF